MTDLKKLSHCASELRWDEIKRLIRNHVMALLPVASQSKEHGHHLPMSTDYQQAEWLIEQLLYEPDLLIFPPVNYGYYPAFTEFPGSISIQEETFVSLVNDICASIFSYGTKKIILLNTGISTINSLKKISDHSQGMICLINIYSGSHFKKAVSQCIKQTSGGHADEVETSIMLAINDSQVDMDKAIGTHLACSQPGRLRRNQPDSPNYTPSGACGKPQEAGIKKGKLLLAAMMKDITIHLSKIRTPAMQ